MRKISLIVSLWLNKNCETAISGIEVLVEAQEIRAFRQEEASSASASLTLAEKYLKIK